MLEIFYRLIFAAFIIVGVWKSFGPGMIFGWIGDALDSWAPKWMQKPIYACPPCMSSVWGGSIWIWSGGSLWALVPFVLALCGLMTLIEDNLLH